MIKEFILEYEDGLKQIIFFSITFGLFALAVIHAMKIKRKEAEEYAMIVLKEEGEENE